MRRLGRSLLHYSRKLTRSPNEHWSRTCKEKSVFGESVVPRSYNLQLSDLEDVSVVPGNLGSQTSA